MCIPCCIDDLKDIEHSCPECNVTLGKHHQTYMGAGRRRRRRRY